MLKKFLVVGTGNFSGIGQVCLKYVEMLKNVHGYDAEYSFILNAPTSFEKWDRVLMFVIPVSEYFEYLNKIKKEEFQKIEIITVCETDPVHPDYGKILFYKKKIWVPSEFARDVLKKQFPHGDFGILRHWIPKPEVKKTKIDPRLKSIFKNKHKYIYYTIGNMFDPRKNLRSILQAWVDTKLFERGSMLLIKNTHNRELKLNIPGVVVINGLLDDNHISYIHKMCDCFVNFSHSEGVGMGAFEASYWGNKTIITEWGGAKEYVKTKFVVPCKRIAIQRDGFLLVKGTCWGEPDYEVLKNYIQNFGGPVPCKKHTEKLIKKIINHEVFVIN